MLTLACKKEHLFLRRRPSGCFLQKSTCVGVCFYSEFCKIFKSTYFEEHLCTAASENVFTKLRKIKIYKDFSTSISETSENVCFYFMIGFP